MDIKLLKKIGMGALALLVVWNTVSIHKTSHRTNKMGGFARRGVPSVSHERGKREMPQMHQGRSRGQKPNKENWSKKEKK